MFLSLAVLWQDTVRRRKEKNERNMAQGEREKGGETNRERESLRSFLIFLFLSFRHCGFVLAFLFAKDEITI